MPLYEKLFPKIAKERNNSEKLDKALRSYCFNLFQKLLICIDVLDISESISLEIEPFTKKIKKFTLKIGDFTKDQTSTDYQFLESCCYYCSEMKYISYSYISVKEKLANVYSNCAIVFGIFDSSKKNKQDDSVKLCPEFFEKFSSIKHLGIINNRIESSEIEKNNYSDLVEINFENNNLDIIPSIVKESKNLSKLNIVRNPIKKFPLDLFENLPNLRVLVLDSLSINEINQFDSTPKKLINLPDSLSELEIKSFPFSYIPFNLENLKDRLTKLTFNGVKWFDRDYYSDSNSMITLDNLREKFDKIFNEKQLSDIFHHFDSAKKNYLNQREIVQFNSFIFKRLPRFEIIPSFIYDFENLNSLDLSFQAIKKVPDEISKLKNLKKLYLNNCILLESISNKLGDIDLKEIELENTLSLKTPPPEICKRGIHSILGYLKRLSTGSVLCKRTKLMLVGLGEAGK